MKLNKYIIALGIAGLAFTSCESEFTNDAELNVNVATNDQVNFDGETITVKKGTPVEFHFKGDPDFLTFFSGEAGKEYKYKDRTQVDINEIKSSNLSFQVVLQYGNPANILSMYIAEDFPGLYTNSFLEDSVLVEKHAWKELIPQAQLPQTLEAKSYTVDMKPYLGKRIAIAICYRGQDQSTAQSKFTFKDMQITNTMSNDSETTLEAASFGLTPINMQHRHNLSDQKKLTSNRAYGSAPKGSPNISGIWNLLDMKNFFIHSSNKGTELKYSWLVSNLLVANGCTPDKGTGLKNITQSLDSYNYTYAEPGTYTASFVAKNSNQKEESTVVREYKVVVTE